MSVNKVIYALLSGNASIQSITDGDIYPGLAPQDTLAPYIVFTQISRVPTKTKDRSNVLETYRIQVDCYAATLYETDALATLVKQVLDFTTGTIAELKVDSISFDDENDFFEDAPELWRIQQDYMVRIKF